MNSPVNDLNQPSLTAGNQAKHICPLCDSTLKLDPAGTVCGTCGLTFDAKTISAMLSQTICREVDGEEDHPSDPLASWLAGEPIEPNPASNRDGLLKWSRENPVRAGIGAAVLLLLLGATLTATWAYTSARAALLASEDENHDRQLQAHAVRQRLENQLAETKLRARQVELEYLQARRDARMAVAKDLAERSHQIGSQNASNSLLLAAQSLKISLADGQVPDTGAHQALRDAFNGRDGIDLLGHTGRVTSLAMSHDNRWLASASFDGDVRIWDLSSSDPNRSVVTLRGHKGCVTSLAFSLNNRWLISGGVDSNVRVWDLSSPSGQAGNRAFRKHAGRLSSLSISRSGRWMVTTSGGFSPQENSTQMWDLSANDLGDATRRLEYGAGIIQTAVISPDSRWLATGGQKTPIRLWDISQGFPSRQPLELVGHRGAIEKLLFVPGGRWLCSASDGTARNNDPPLLWNLADSPPQSVPLHGHVSAIETIAASEDGHWLLTASDNDVLAWDLRDAFPAKDVRKLRGHSSEVRDIVVDASGHWFISGSSDKTARIWRLSSQGPERESVVLRGSRGGITNLAASPNGRWLAGAAQGNSIRLWSLDLESLVEQAFDAAGDSVAEFPTRQPTIPRSAHLRAVSLPTHSVR